MAVGVGVIECEIDLIGTVLSASSGALRSTLLKRIEIGSGTGCAILIECSSVLSKVLLSGSRGDSVTTANAEDVDCCAALVRGLVNEANKRPTIVMG